MFTTTTQMLRDAQAGGYAIGGFNVENMEMALAVVAVAEETRSPVILQTTPSTVRYASLPVFRGMIEAMARAATVPVALHLDHGDGFELAVRAILGGYTSVMIDGSRLPLDENIALTRRVVRVAACAGIPVEAELGTVGGKEDDLDGGAGGYTDPGDAARFAEEAGASSLAVAIGTAHGLYAAAPRLDFGRLEAIRARVSIPLVLHGGTGVPDADVARCIALGIGKVNYATELRIAYTDGVKAALASDPALFDPKRLGAAGMDRVKALVAHKLEVCGALGRAG